MQNVFYRCWTYGAWQGDDLDDREMLWAVRSKDWESGHPGDVWVTPLYVPEDGFFYDVGIGEERGAVLELEDQYEEVPESEVPDFVWAGLMKRQLS